MMKKNLALILHCLRDGLAQILGNRLAGVYLYGSQARGDARPDSDIDALVVLHGDFDYGHMLKLTSELAWRLSLDNDVVVSLVYVSKERFDLIDTPFLLNVHREAIPVSE